MTVRALTWCGLTPEDRAIFQRCSIRTEGNYRSSDVLALLKLSSQVRAYGSVVLAVAAAELEAASLERGRPA